MTTPARQAETRPPRRPAHRDRKPVLRYYVLLLVVLAAFAVPLGAGVSLVLALVDAVLALVVFYLLRVLVRVARRRS
jgi:Flp pilus assembly protein TadB